MDIKSFESIIKTENKAKKYLEKLCKENNSISCIRCGSKEFYKIRRDNFRCKNCRYEFGIFTGRWISKLKISCREWLWLIKLFELEISARKVSIQMGISYPTILKAFNIIRMTITQSSTDGNFLLCGEVEIDETYFGGRQKGKRGRGSKNKIPVFGILERKGTVRVEVLKNVTAEEILSYTVKTVRRGSIVYTDKFRSYDSLMFCGYRHIKIDHGKHFCKGKGLYKWS